MNLTQKGIISKKYYDDEGNTFQKIGNDYKLINTTNMAYQIFLNESFEEKVWDFIKDTDIYEGEEHETAYNQLIQQFRTGNTIFNTATDILLKKDEKVMYVSYSNIYLKEARAVRTSKTNYGGGSVRVSKNVRLNGGGANTVSQSNDVIKTIDIGQLTITNKRFIYTGEKRTVDVNISQITSVKPYSDAIMLQRKRKQKAEYYTNINSYMFKTLYNNKSHLFRMDGVMMKAMIEAGFQ